MVNFPKAKAMVEHLQAALEKLQTLSRLSEEEFFGDFTKSSSAKYLLQIAIECCLNLGNHIISSGNYRAPEDYADVFKVLAENRIIPEDFVTQMQKMARFRNRIVHIYWDIEDRMIYMILQEHLGDFERFLKFITTYIAQG